MRVSWHVLVAAGWLAHMANQTMIFDNWTRDRVRPGRLVLWCGFLVVMAVAPMIEGSPNPERSFLMSAVTLWGVTSASGGWLCGLPW